MTVRTQLPQLKREIFEGELLVQNISGGIINDYSYKKDSFKVGSCKTI